MNQELMIQAGISKETCKLARPQVCSLKNVVLQEAVGNRLPRAMAKVDWKGGCRL